MLNVVTRDEMLKFAFSQNSKLPRDAAEYSGIRAILGNIVRESSSWRLISLQT